MSTWDKIEAAAKTYADTADADLTRALDERDAFLTQLNEELSTNVELFSKIADLKTRIAELEAGNLKPALQGLIVTKPENLDTVPYAEFGSMKLRWNGIETSPGVFNFAALDAALADHPDVKFRVRFMAGIHAPEWVKARSGGAIQHNPSTQAGGSGLVPRFWTENYYVDYMLFMNAIADRYEGNPQVVEVTNSLTTTIYAEPFILGADAATIDRYWNAGYRKTLVQEHLRDSIDDMMALFPTTRISLACHNKWEFIVEGASATDGQFASSWPEERTLLNKLIDTYGPRLVLDDHGLEDSDPWFPVGEPRETATSLYAYMSGLRDTDQTYGWQFTMKEGASMAVAADHGLAMRACFLELAAFDQLEPVLRKAVHDALLANAAGKP